MGKLFVLSVLINMVFSRLAPTSPMTWFINYVMIGLGIITLIKFLLGRR